MHGKFSLSLFIDDLHRLSVFTLAIFILIHSYFLTNAKQAIKHIIGFIINDFLNFYLKHYLFKPIIKDKKLPIIGYGLRPAGAYNCSLFRDGINISTMGRETDVKPAVSTSYGFPSGHSQTAGYTFSYVSKYLRHFYNNNIAKQQPKPIWQKILNYCILSAYCLVLLYMLYLPYTRVRFNCHTIQQAIFGFIFGVVFFALYDRYAFQNLENFMAKPAYEDFTDSQSQNSPSPIITRDYNAIFRVMQNSGFLAKITETDAIARNIPSTKTPQEFYQEALQKASEIPFSDEEKEKLEEGFDIALKQFAQSSLHIDIEHLHNIIRFFRSSRDIEEGMPHTHGNFILISERFFEKSREEQHITIIHEILHIIFRERGQNHMMNNVYTKIPNVEFHQTYRYIPQELKDKLRNNPDLDDFIYAFNSNPIYATYTSSSPKSLTDIKVSITEPIQRQLLNTIIQSFQNPTEVYQKINIQKLQFEHPNELLASFLAQIIYLDIKIPSLLLNI